MAGGPFGPWRSPGEVTDTTPDPLKAEWKTGTSIDSYTPVYQLLADRGIRPNEADMMDITTVATLLGVSARPPEPELVDGLKPPPWWGGDAEAADSSIEAARQMGFTVGMMT